MGPRTMCSLVFQSWPALQEFPALVQQVVVSVASHADLIQSLARNQTVTSDSAGSADIEPVLNPHVRCEPVRHHGPRSATSARTFHYRLRKITHCKALMLSYTQAAGN